MASNILVTFTLVLVGAILCQGLAFGQCPKVKPLQGGFDLSKFLGVWYTIARTDITWENDLRCSFVSYTYGMENTIRVDNQGIDSRNETVSAVGLAFQPDKTIPNQLEVFYSNDNIQLESPENQAFLVDVPDQSLLSQSSAKSTSYWVVDTDYANYALLISCSDTMKLFKTQSAWMVSRYHTMDFITGLNLVRKLEEIGFPKKSMKPVDQINCTY